MTEEQAGTVANILIAAVGAGAAYCVLRNRSLRRKAWQVVRQALVISGPWLVSEARQAWVVSGHRTPSSPPAPSESGGVARGI